MEIRLLGPCEADVDGVDVPLGGPRQRAVLAMLALAAPDVVSTDRLVDGIWGEEPPAKPLPTLQVFISNLRKALRDNGADDVLASVRPGYKLAPTVTTDIARFQQLRADGQAAAAFGTQEGLREAAGLLDQALALSRGTALADLRELPFAEAEAARLDELLLAAAEDRFTLALRLGRHHEVVGDLQEQVRLHPTRERLWAHLMTALYRSDRAADALAAYASARDRLADELGIDPGEALQELELRILRQDPALAGPAPLAVHPTVVPPAAPRPSGRIPVPTTSTFGRETLVSTVADTTLAPTSRVVTLTGPGGSGKSRVALLAAREVEGQFDRVSYLIATEQTDRDQLLREIGHLVLGSEPEDPLQALASAATGPVLVVLDNLEVLPDAAALVQDLVSHADAVTVLVTSRLPLRITSEHEVPVPPLEVPPPDATPEEIDRTPAVALFDARARAAQPTFSIAEHREDVAALVRFLDGVPLALELAAARLRLMTPAAILDHLRRDLGLLRATASDVPDRQRTLTATLQWSYDRLDADAQLVCDRATLFERSFTLEALEAICDDIPSVFDAMSAVLDARLMRIVESRVEVRFVVLGTVRAFARARLLEQPGIDTRRARLVDHLMTRAETWRTDLDGPEGAVVLGRFADELDDMASALAWLIERGDASGVRRLSRALDDVWVASGRVPEGRALALRAHTTDAGPETALVAGKLAYHLTEWDDAERWFRLALDGAEPGSVVAAEAECYLGGCLVVTGRAEDGVVHAAAARAAQPELYPMQAIALSIQAIAAAVSGDFATETRLYQERLAVVRRRGDRARIADTLNTLAEICLDDLDAETAAVYAEESLTLAGSGLPGEARDALITLARARLVEGDEAAAIDLTRRALRLSEHTGQSLALAQCLRIGGAIASVRGESAVAVRLFAAAQELSPSPSGGDEPVERDLAARLDTARAAIGAQAVRQWQAGSMLPLASARSQLEQLLS